MVINSFPTKTAIVTGSAGFIGFFVSQKLLDNGWYVVGVDCFTDYYSISLKEMRNKLLEKNDKFLLKRLNVSKPGVMSNLMKEVRPDMVIHLAAQAGVRYSIQEPRTYLESNIVGSFELLEACRQYTPKHLLIASTSSVYGESKDTPYNEDQMTDKPISFYAATKKSVENIAYTYSHLFKIPITIFRFFTVYGPWGRPDMALFKFTNSILEGNPIEVYNNGQMRRDFTYIEDLVHSIFLLSRIPPSIEKNSGAPCRVLNIGNSKSILLLDFVREIEKALNKSAKKIFLPIQAGDVPVTWANTDALKKLTGYTPNTKLSEGILEFVSWYMNYYRQE